MLNLRSAYLAAITILLGLNVYAADDVQFTLKATSSGPGIAVPTLTWAASPSTANCVASGDWTGTKPATGTVTLGPVSGATKNYGLTCTFSAADTQATVSWTVPTTNTDDTPLTDLASYNVYWNSGDPSLVSAPSGKVRSVPLASTPMTTITSLAAGTWNFAVTAVNSKGVESPLSNIVSKTTGPGSIITKSAVLAFPGTMVITVR